MKDFIDDIKTKLGIVGGRFIDAEIEEYVSEIDTSRHLEFFKALSGEHGFSKPMDRIANVAKQFSKDKENQLFSGSYELAKSMYDKFYYQHSKMTDYCTANRHRIPSDREFFNNCDFKALINSDKSKTYSDKEIYVLGELGGAEWLLSICSYANSKKVIDDIEKIIKTTITKKYLTKEETLLGGVTDRLRIQK